MFIQNYIYTDEDRENLKKSGELNLVVGNPERLSIKEYFHIRKRIKKAMQIMQIKEKDRIDLIYINPESFEKGFPVLIDRFEEGKARVISGRLYNLVLKNILNNKDYKSEINLLRG